MRNSVCDQQGQVANQLSEDMETSIMHGFSSKARVSEMIFKKNEPQDSFKSCCNSLQVDADLSKRPLVLLMLEQIAVPPNAPKDEGPQLSCPQNPEHHGAADLKRKAL